MTSAQSSSGRWSVGGPAVPWAVAGFVLLLIGLAATRPQVAALGMPLVLATTWSWIRRPHAQARLALERCGYRTESGRVEAELRLESPEGTAYTRVRIAAPGHRTVDVLLSSPRPRSVELSVSGTRTGRRVVFSSVYLVSSLDNLLRSDPRTLGPVELTVVPRTRTLRELPLPFRLQGLTGAHDSRRIGQGGEFHDISQFTPGDRLRRIDWRVTARRAGHGKDSPPGRLTQVYVRRSHATADAVVILVMDSRDDLGPDVSTWTGARPVNPDDPTSLDIAREAAGSLARRYLEVGDRVGVVDLARPWRPLRPAGGRRHLHRVLHQLAESYPTGEIARRVRAPQLPSGAMVVIFSTFLDEEPVDLARMWRGVGHRVLTVDVMPPPDVVALRSYERTAHRIVEIERQDRLWRLASTGAEIVAWNDEPGGRRSLLGGFSASARRRAGRR